MKASKLKESSNSLTKLKHRNIVSVNEILVDEKGTIYVVDELYALVVIQLINFQIHVPNAKIF